ncbi:MAG: peptidoglycan DD-metalloendopeptidase family protein [Planctomycetes bacterium]|nr:peptidoglycan DD-metalloendopeptidase family protein [Planctomycetota bacterium]
MGSIPIARSIFRIRSLHVAVCVLAVSVALAGCKSGGAAGGPALRRAGRGDDGPRPSEVAASAPAPASGPIVPVPRAPIGNDGASVPRAAAPAAPVANVHETLPRELAFLRDDPNRPLEPTLDAPPRPLETIAPARAAEADAAARGSAPAGVVVHVVARGDTLWAISREYGVTLKALTEANTLRDPARLEIGQKLNVPGARRSAAAAGAGTGPAAPVPGADAEPERGEAGYAWPVKGKVLGDYGVVGIEIGAPLGADVRATKSGVVAWSSERFQGFGKTVILRHAGGVISFYAFCSEITVKDGERVRQGQVIARVGQSGRAVLPLLLFRVYQDGRPLAPRRLLP